MPIDPAALTRLRAFQRELEGESLMLGDALMRAYAIGGTDDLAFIESVRKAKRTFAADLRALLEERKARDGYVLVPREPTEAMLAGYHGLYRTRISKSVAQNIWEEMIAAAQGEHSTGEAR